jgi:hypothetical protein
LVRGFRKTGNTLYIEPGLKTRYSHIAAVPDNAAFVLIHGKFLYQDEKEFHTADKLMKVPDRVEMNDDSRNTGNK